MPHRTVISILISALMFVMPLGTDALQGPTSTDVPTKAPANSPTEVVERFQDELLSVMKEAEKLRFHGRFERLAFAVRASHDLPTIAQIAVGSYWDGLSEKQQMLLVDKFRKLSIATYAHRFDGYSGEAFKTQSSDKLSPDVASVHTVFLRPGEEEIRFDYLLHRSNQGFRIVNIVVDGVSDLALKRSEYTEILGDKGFDALIARLKEKIADFSKSQE
jgi:phospholipid transport system substrate-binding protein